MPAVTDDKFSRLARKMRFLNEAQLAELRRRQGEVARMGAKLALSEIAQTDLVLTAEQAKKVQLACEYLDVLAREEKLGALAVEKGLASGEELKVCLDTHKYEFALHRRIPRPLGEIMIEAEILTPESLRALSVELARRREDEQREPTVVEAPAPKPAPGRADTGTGTKTATSGQMRAARPEAAAPGSPGAAARTPTSGQMRSVKPPTPAPGMAQPGGKTPTSGSMKAVRPDAAPASAPAKPAVPGRLPARPDEATMPYEADRIGADDPTPAQGFPARNAPGAAHDSDVEPSSSGMPTRPRPAPARPGAPSDRETRRITARLVQKSADGLDSAFPLAGRVVLGRQPGCSIRVDDARMSREHAAVEYDQQLRHHVVNDLGSRNGTLVNGVKIASPTVLNPGDEVRVGDSIFIYEA